MRILFMLPARSGSKGVKDKNIKKLNGKPLMYYAIQAILSSKIFIENDCYVMLNTDSKEYADIAESIGANVPFIRNKQLADDNSIISDVIKDTICFFERKNIEFDLFAMIQVTSPLITKDDIDNAIQMFIEDNELDTINSVTESEVMPLWCNTLDEDLSMENFISDDIRKMNRQQLPKYYRITGAIRVSRWKQFVNNEFDWYKGKVKAFIMDNSHSIDIDTIEDFELAELKMKRREENA